MRKQMTLKIQALSWHGNNLETDSDDTLQRKKNS